MANLDRELRRVISELDTALKELGKTSDFDNVRPRAQPPASPELIKRYEGHLGRALPASYRAFLELHNGYEWLAFPGHMLSIESVMPGGEWHPRIQEWKQRSARYGSGEVIDGIVIANMGQPNNWAYLDPNRPSGTQELTVVEWTPEDSQDFPDLVAFLEECLETVKYDESSDET